VPAGSPVANPSAAMPSSVNTVVPNQGGNPIGAGMAR
jgi:hypothetical protein